MALTGPNVSRAVIVSDDSQRYFVFLSFPVFVFIPYLVALFLSSKGEWSAPNTESHLTSHIWPLM